MTARKLALATALMIGVSPIALVAQETFDEDLYRAAQHYYKGDSASAIKLWKHWAQQGDVNAAYNLGTVYHYASGVPYDAAEAMRWYEMAAKGGDRASQYELGMMYLKGEGVPADAKRAHEWFTQHRRAHLHNHHSAQFLEWQTQARALLEAQAERDRVSAMQRDSEAVLAELKRRAGMSTEVTTSRVAAFEPP